MPKTAVAKRTYQNADGSETRHAKQDSEVIRFDFANGKSATIAVADVHEDVRNAAFVHGLNQKIGDAFAGAKGNADDAYDSAVSMIERLMEGIWVTARESAGPSTGLLVEAIVRAKVAAGEKADTFTDERKAEIAAKLKGADGAATKKLRDGALANAEIKAAYEAIRAERAATKAREAAKAAKTAPKAEGESTLAAF